MVKHSVYACVLVGSTMVGVSQAAVVYDNFSSYDSITGGAAPLSANYAINGTTTGALVIKSTQGVGGSQAIGFIGGQPAGTYNPTPDFTLVNKTAIDLTVTATYRISAFFQRNNSNNGQANPDLAFLGDTTQLVNAANAIGARVNGSTQLQLRNNNGSAGTAVSLSLTDGNWYQLVVDVTRTATTNLFDLSASLYNATSGGVVGSLVGTTASAGVTNSGLWNDSASYGGVRFTARDNGNAGAQTFDNFSAGAVPEPASVAALALAGFGLGLRRRRA